MYGIGKLIFWEIPGSLDGLLRVIAFLPFYCDAFHPLKTIYSSFLPHSFQLSDAMYYLQRDSNEEYGAET